PLDDIGRQFMLIVAPSVPDRGANDLAGRRRNAKNPFRILLIDATSRIELWRRRPVQNLSLLFANGATLRIREPTKRLSVRIELLDVVRVGDFGHASVVDV